MKISEICETHWLQAGQERLSLEDVLLCSGRKEENTPHTQGIALMLSQETWKALIR